MPDLIGHLITVFRPIFGYGRPKGQLVAQNRLFLFLQLVSRPPRATKSAFFVSPAAPEHRQGNKQARFCVILSNAKNLRLIASV